MLVARISVRAVSGLRETLTNHTNAIRLVSKSVGSYPLQRSRQLCLTAEYQSNRHDQQGTAVSRAKKPEDNVKVLEAKLAQKDKEIEELKTAIRSTLAPLNELVRQPPKRKPSQKPEGERKSKKPRIDKSNDNSGQGNNQEDQSGNSLASEIVTGYLHH